jgi:hypothetical protein
LENLEPPTTTLRINLLFPHEANPDDTDVAFVKTIPGHLPIYEGQQRYLLLRQHFSRENYLDSIDYYFLAVEENELIIRFKDRLSSIPSLDKTLEQMRGAGWDVMD